MHTENVPGNEANSDSRGKKKHNDWDGFWFVHGIVAVSVCLVGLILSNF